MKLFWIGILLMLSIWLITVYVIHVDPILIPTPRVVGSSLIEMISSGDLPKNITATLYRLFLGFTISLIAVPVGLLMGYYPKIYSALEVVIDFLRSIPSVALYPVFIWLYGISGNKAKIAVVVFGCSLVILINTLSGVINCNKNRIMVAKTMRFSDIRIFTNVIFLEALPQIFVGFRVSISLALIIVIVTEMFIGSNTGIGKGIYDAQQILHSGKMWAGILITGMLGYLLNKCLMWLEQRYIHWAGK
jgi:NitT/TauT family transport system permease protein